MHHKGTHDADVTEGGRGTWERLYYDWSDPYLVKIKTTASNVFGGASGYTYTLTRQPNGTTDVDVVIVREGENLKGRVLAGVLGTVGKNVLGKGVHPQRQGHRSPHRRERGVTLVAATAGSRTLTHCQYASRSAGLTRSSVNI